MVSELILVRHGQASFSAETYDKLSETGMRQARILADYWQVRGDTFDYIYSGSLLRQRETAESLLPLLKGDSAHCRTHEGFNEYSAAPLLDIYLRDHAEPGENNATGTVNELENKFYQLTFKAATNKWIEGKLIPSAVDTDFETFAAFQSRVFAAVEDVMKAHGKGSRVLVSTSGGVIAMTLQKVLRFPDEQIIDTNWMIKNSSVTTIQYGGGRMSLTQFNGISHLDTVEYRGLITYR